MERANRVTRVFWVVPETSWSAHVAVQAGPYLASSRYGAVEIGRQSEKSWITAPGTQLAPSPVPVPEVPWLLPWDDARSTRSGPLAPRALMATEEGDDVRGDRPPLE